MTENERVRELRKTLTLTLEKFGERLGVKKNAISAIENGRNSLTDQMTKAICREFDVNEEWLRTGEGSMFVEMSRAEQAARIVANALNTEDDFVLNTFIALGQLSPDEWQTIKSFINKIKGS